MTPEMKKEIIKLIQEEVTRLIPNLFGKSLLQIKEYFGININ